MNEKLCLQLLQIVLSDKIQSCELMFCKEESTAVDWDELYSFFSDHSIIPLTASLLEYVPDSYGELKKVWKDSVYSNIFLYSQLVKQQKQVLNAFIKNHIPVVVIKGTSAAKYYPKPQLRTMGDIDLLVKPENYDCAVNCLISIGFKEYTGEFEIKEGRHRSFHNNNVSVELHHFFSKRVSIEEKDALDNLLYNAISNSETVLPDEENGLVLLSHIRQHLEMGLGLRQIIDWMMFVKACLNDEMWRSSFCDRAQKTGLKMLAVTVTKMCQMYLGLTDNDISWCKDANNEVCSALMNYIMESGNFGKRRDIYHSGITSKIPSLKHPIRFFKHIQSHGECNWKAIKDYPYLKPLSWIYQMCLYLKFAYRNKIGMKSLNKIYAEGEKRNELFFALGIK